MWFWSILAEKLVLVEFGREKWFWSLFAGKTGFSPNKLVFVDFSRKSHLSSVSLSWAHLGLEVVFYFFDLNTGPCGNRTQDLWRDSDERMLPFRLTV